MEKSLDDLKHTASKATQSGWTNHDAKRGRKKSVWVRDTARERPNEVDGRPSLIGPDRQYIANALAGWRVSDKQALANADFIATFDPPTALKLIEIVTRSRDSLKELINHAERLEMNADPERFREFGHSAYVSDAYDLLHDIESWFDA